MDQKKLAVEKWIWSDADFEKWVGMIARFMESHDMKKWTGTKKRGLRDTLAG